ncbi:amidohydrolase family protein [Streptomyces sp. NPDC057654]|uniref:amidohydrolase family protein n=1 Tax=Streptomyces sp. NPDC057654 TaxID=3346196 RepID=UPI00369AE7D2
MGYAGFDSGVAWVRPACGWRSGAGRWCVVGRGGSAAGGGGGAAGRGVVAGAGVDGVAAWPERFIGFLSVPLGLEPEEVAATVEREVVGRGLRGIGELTPPPGRAEVIEPVLRAAADHGGLPVVVHGFAPTTADDLVTLSALAGRYPAVPLVVSQLGGLNWMRAVELVRDTPNMYLELSTANIVFAVRLAIKEIPDRTLFGSDAPYGDPALTRAMVERVTSPGEIRDRVLGGTAAELIGLA